MMHQLCRLTHLCVTSVTARGHVTPPQPASAAASLITLRTANTGDDPRDRSAAMSYTQDGHDQAGHTEPVSLRLLMMRRGLALLSYVWRLFTWRAG